MKLFHIVSISDTTGDIVFLTRYPMSHHKACVMRMKFTEHKHRLIQLVECAA